MLWRPSCCLWNQNISTAPVCFLFVQVQRPLIGIQVQTFQKCKTMSTGKMALVNWLLLVLPHFPSYVRLALDQSLPGPTCGAGSVDLITDRNGEVYKVRLMTHKYIFLYLCKHKQAHNCLEEKWQQLFLHFLIFVTFPALVLLGVPFLRISTKDLCVTLLYAVIHNETRVQGGCVYKNMSLYS